MLLIYFFSNRIRITNTGGISNISSKFIPFPLTIPGFFLKTGSLIPSITNPLLKPALNNTSKGRWK